MAGFDFQVPVKPSERSFAVVLLRELQRLACVRLCDRQTVVRFNWHRPQGTHNYHRYTVSVEGDFAEVQAFAVDAISSLQHFARGFHAAQPIYIRSLLPAVVPISLLKRVSELSDEMHQLESYTSTLGANLRLNSYLFRKTGHDVVDRVLVATTNVLLQWRSNKLSGPTLVEQIHTACEVSLKAALGTSAHNVAFRTLVTEAGGRSIIDAGQIEALLALKQTRRNSKHRGQGIKSTRLSTIVQTSVGALHSLASACAKTAKPVARPSESKS